MLRRLVDFPYVLVRLRCDLCRRAGAYRLVRLAVKFGSEILLDDLLLRLSADCPWRTIHAGVGAERISPTCRRAARQTCRYESD